MRTLPNACPDCRSDMVLRDSRYGPFYGCSRFPSCRATHGAHPDGRPLGVPADARTKAARIGAHAAFDPIWKSDRSRSRNRARGAAYRWLQRAMGLSAWPHIGEMNAEQCELVIRLCAEREVLARRYDWWEFIPVEVDKSWAEWRSENPGEVERLRVALAEVSA